MKKKHLTQGAQNTSRKHSAQNTSSISKAMPTGNVTENTHKSTCDKDCDLQAQHSENSLTQLEFTRTNDIYPMSASVVVTAADEPERVLQVLTNKLEVGFRGKNVDLKPAEKCATDLENIKENKDDGNVDLVEKKCRHSLQAGEGLERPCSNNLSDLTSKVCNSNPRADEEIAAEITPDDVNDGVSETVSVEVYTSPVVSSQSIHRQHRVDMDDNDTESSLSYTEDDPESDEDGEAMENQYTIRGLNGHVTRILLGNNNEEVIAVPSLVKHGLENGNVYTGAF